jgi:hypothetical protein
MDKTLGWMALPDELRPHNYDIRNISLQETEQLFKRADKLGVLERFAELFWDTISLAKQSNASLQKCIKLLEEQKRLIGRQYDKMPSNTLVSKARKNYVAEKYNEIEYQIRWMVKTFELTRTSEPYLLEVKQ